MLSIVFALWGCSSTPTVTGSVQDIWNKPIEGAMIQMEGTGTQQSSDAQGKFSFSLQDVESGNVRFRAGHADFIHDVEVLVYSPEMEGDTIDALTFNLYPKPANKGFFAVGQREYSELVGGELVEYASPFKKVYGLARVGNVKLNDSTPSFVYHSTLRKEEIKQINLGVYKLAFTEKEAMTSFLGDIDVEIDLWVADGSAIPFNLRSLDQEHMYLIEFPSDLTPGVYAFSGRYLEGKSEAANLPKELQVAYTFEIK